MPLPSGGALQSWVEPASILSLPTQELTLGAARHCYPKVSHSPLPPAYPPTPSGRNGAEPWPPPQWQGESQVLGEFALTNYFLFLGKKSCSGDELLTRRKRRLCSLLVLIRTALPPGLPPPSLSSSLWLALHILLWVH